MAPWWPGATLLLSKAPRKLVFLFTLSLSITYLFYSLLSCYSSLQFPLQETSIFLQPEPGSNSVDTTRTSSSKPQTSKREDLFIQETPRRLFFGREKDGASTQVSKTVSTGKARLSTSQSSFGVSIATDDKKWISGGPSLSGPLSDLGDLSHPGAQQTSAWSHSPSFSKIGSEVPELHFSVSSSAPARRTSALVSATAPKINSLGSSDITSTGPGAGTSSSAASTSTGLKQNTTDSSAITSSGPRLRTLDRETSTAPGVSTLDSSPIASSGPRASPRVSTLDRAPSTSAGVSTLDSAPGPYPYAYRDPTHPIALGFSPWEPYSAPRASNSGRALGTPDLTLVPSADLGSREPPGRNIHPYNPLLASSSESLHSPTHFLNLLDHQSSHPSGAIPLTKDSESSLLPDQKSTNVHGTRDTLFVIRTRTVTPLYKPSQTTDTVSHPIQESVSHKANDQRIPTQPSPRVSISRSGETSGPLVSTGKESQPALSSWDRTPLATTEMITESQAGYLEKEPQESSTTEEELSRRNGINTTEEYGDKKLPQAIIIGVKKGGTRALLEALRAHPDVRAVGVEPHFFDRNYDKGLEWYRDLMPRTVDGQITMEKTPSYFVTNEAPQRIHSMAKDTKLIVVVRNPITRAISDYTQTLSKKPEIPTFEVLAFKNRTLGLIDASWSALRIGIYALHLESWMQYFPLSQILFVSGERLISNPAEELAKVQEFLGLRRIITDKHFYFNKTKGFPCLKKPEDTGAPRCLGKSKGRIHPKIDPDVIRRLRKFYKPFNAMFYQMTGEDFQWEKEELEG